MLSRISAGRALSAIVLLVLLPGLLGSEASAKDPALLDIWTQRGLELDVQLDESGNPIPGSQRDLCPPPAPLGLQDITCYQPGQPCAFLQNYTAGTAVARLKFRYRKADGTIWLRSATGFVFDPPGAHAGRTDLLLTNKHVITFPAGSVILNLHAEFFAEYGPVCQCGAAVPPAVCGLLETVLAPFGGVLDPDCLMPLTSCTGIKVGIGCWVAPEECDWALVKLAPPGAPGGVVPAVLGVDLTNVGAVFIVQHPKGRCKEFAENAVAGILPGWEFEHEVDTQKGSSGSPAFIPGTNTVVGIHYRGGCADGGFNGAVKISAVNALLPAAITQVDSEPWTVAPPVPDPATSSPPTCQDGPNAGSPCLTDNECQGGTCSEADVEDILDPSIPTVSEWGLAAMMILLIVAGIVVVRARGRVDVKA